LSTPAETETLLHASCVAIGGRAVLLKGGSGAGKSDLALRLIDRGAMLVADDSTLVRPAGGGLVARAPATIAGLIEVRGIGIVAFPHVDDVPVVMVVVLDQPGERLPQRGVTVPVAGIALPMLALTAYEASTPIKIELAMRRSADERTD
jgi:serine kinase of HPr protein (carbohydrate metabolism regulator)